MSAQYFGWQKPPFALLDKRFKSGKTPNNEGLKFYGFKSSGCAFGCSPIISKFHFMVKGQLGSHCFWTYHHNIDLLTACLMPTCLSRDNHPCARSISWSYPGFAPNSGCLLAVCTTEGRVKLFRPPYCDFRAEWVEVIDISDLLHDYLKSVIFGELHPPSALSPQKQANADSFTLRGCVIESKNCISSRHPRRRKRKTVVEGDFEDFLESQDSSPRPGRCADRRENDDFFLITTEQYASRSALLSSLVVAWSPAFQSSGDSAFVSNKRAILAVGGKSGNISFWKICEPQGYTIEHGGVSVDGMLMGLLQAHNSWITAISWGLYAGSSSDSVLVLATGSSDGSVKIWSEDVDEVIHSSNKNRASFSLLVEITAVTHIPISAISLVLPIQSQDKVVLAIGKGSGSVEAWVCHISSRKLQSASVHGAHDQVVTGLAWGLDSCCLYSCSQDNSVRSWVLHGNYLHEVTFPSKFPGSHNSTNLSRVSDQCFGLALSPGELMVAVVHSFDAKLLNQMYQARKQRAVVEFFWIGGQSREIPSEEHLNCSSESSSSLSQRELYYWESNILRSLRSYDNADRLLVLWDVIAALIAFKNNMPTFVDNLLLKWILSWFPFYEEGDSVEKISSHAQSLLSKISCRKIHLLNIICRRLMLSNVKACVPNREQHELKELNDDQWEVDLWNNLLISNEKELQERLVVFTFTAILRHVTCPQGDLSTGTNCLPVGVAQMDQWVAINHGLMHNQLKDLQSKIRELGIRIHSFCEYVMEETCGFCCAPIPFESPEAAWCEGSKLENGSKENHRLSRCAVSMKVCSITSPIWFCMCCHRWTSKLAPQMFFTLPKSPLDVDADCEYFALHQRSKPLCPFCGILLQRSMPEFLLSIFPV